MPCKPNQFHKAEVHHQWSCVSDVFGVCAGFKIPCAAEIKGNKEMQNMRDMQDMQIIKCRSGKVQVRETQAWIQDWVASEM